MSSPNRPEIAPAANFISNIVVKFHNDRIEGNFDMLTKHSGRNEPTSTYRNNKIRLKGVNDRNLTFD